jgi:hypothetical protein
MNLLDLGIAYDVAHRWSPTVAEEREGVTVILVEVSLWHRGHGVDRATVIGGGGQWSLVCQLSGHESSLRERSKEERVIEIPPMGEVGQRRGGVGRAAKRNAGGRRSSMGRHLERK